MWGFSRPSRGPSESDGPLLVAEVLAEQRVVARLTEAGATTAAHAQQLVGLPLMEMAALETLLRTGVVCEAAPGSYYLVERDEGAWWMTRRRRAGLVFALVVLILALVALGIAIAR